MASISGGKGGSGHREQRLRSWKEIAAFFGADERAVRRWEARGLPVRRLPGAGRSTVYAEVAELRDWLSAPSAPAGLDGDKTKPPEAAKDRARGRRWLLIGMATLVLLGALAWFLARPSHTPQAAAPSAEANELYLAAVYQWERRTPESLARARDLFGQAIAREPDYAPAYVGLANTHLLLREYSNVPPAEAYPRAEAAARRALALDPNLAEAHVANAFVTFYWRRDWAAGLAGFRRGLALDPRSARARHWYATALYHTGDIPAALAQIEEARRLNPQSRAIVADRALLTYLGGRREEALAALRQMAASEPEFLSPHYYLAFLLAGTDRFSEWLTEARTVARMRGNAAEAAMFDRLAATLEREGPVAMLAALSAERRRRYAAGEGSAYDVAACSARLGRREEAIRYLRLSRDRREEAYLSLRVDPAFNALRGDAEFQSLAREVGRG